MVTRTAACLFSSVRLVFFRANHWVIYWSASAGAGLPHDAGPLGVVGWRFKLEVFAGTPLFAANANVSDAVVKNRIKQRRPPSKPPTWIATNSPQPAPAPRASLEEPTTLVQPKRPSSTPKSWAISESERRTGRAAMQHREQHTRGKHPRFPNASTRPPIFSRSPDLPCTITTHFCHSIILSMLLFLFYFLFRGMCKHIGYRDITHHWNSANPLLANVRV